jgi:hypothetical protein
MIHGNKEKTHKKTRAFKRGQVTSATDNEKSSSHQNLEIAALNEFRKNVGRCGRHNHLGPSGCHRCYFVPRKWEAAHPFPENHRGIERAQWHRAWKAAHRI